MNVPIKTEPTVVPAALVPANMAEAMQLSNLMASAKLVPPALQKSPADCLMVILQAIRWNMDVFAVAQECSVIQGKLMHSGKLVAAVINARGNLAERLAFTYEGEGDGRTITVSGRMFGETEPRTVTVVLRDARTANKVWSSQPDQQLMYAGSRVWARRHAPELMLGVYSPEEFDDPQPLSESRRIPKAPAPNVMLHDPETGELHDEPSPQEESTAVEPAASITSKPPEAAGSLSVEDMAMEAAQRGEAVFRKFYKSRSPPEQERINAIGDDLRSVMGGGT